MTAASQRQCFDLWMLEHQRILHAVANGFANGDDRHDLMQELLLAVWRAIPAFQGQSKPVTFIYRVAHNTALTWKRSEKNYRARLDRFEALQPPTGTPANPEESSDREMLAFAYAEIRRLPPVDRSLLLLHLDEVGYAEMANILGLTESNVGVRLTRIKQRLIKTLKEKTHELR